jgi:hypothetical protein
MFGILKMFGLTTKISPRPRRRLLEEDTIYANPDLDPSKSDNWQILREINDFYMAAHNSSDEEMLLLERLKTGGFDIERLQEEGVLRFMSLREGYYHMPQNSLLNLSPERMNGTIVEFMGSRYLIHEYTDYFTTPTVKVSRYERSGFYGDYRHKGTSIGPLMQKPKNGLELLAFTLQQQKAFLKAG